MKIDFYNRLIFSVLCRFVGQTHQTTFEAEYFITMDIQNILRELNIQSTNPGVMIGTDTFGTGPVIESISPVDGRVIASLTSATEEEYERSLIHI